MKVKFVVQDLKSKQYWHSHYAKTWTDDIYEAYFFDTKSEVKDWIKRHRDTLQGQFLVIVEVWIP